MPSRVEERASLARAYLLDCGDIRATLFQLASRKPVPSRGVRRIDSFLHMLDDWRESKEDRRLIEGLKVAALERQTPPLPELARADTILEELRSLMESFLQLHEDQDSPRSATAAARAEQILQRLGAPTTDGDYRNFRQHMDQVKALIYAEPGMFIRMLYERLNSPTPQLASVTRTSGSTCRSW